VRRALVQTRAQYVGTIRSMLRSEGLVVSSCAAEALVGRLKATRLPPAARDVIEPLVVALEAIGPQIEKVDEQLDKLSAEQPVVQLLSSAPGVGRIVSAAYISVIDNPGRFRNAHQVEAYLGLVPSESTCGKRKLGAIYQAGQRLLWAMWRNNNSYDRSKVGHSSARGKRQEAGRTEVAAATIEEAAVAATWAAAARQDLGMSAGTAVLRSASSGTYRDPDCASPACFHHGTRIERTGIPPCRCAPDSPAAQR